MTSRLAESEASGLGGSEDIALGPAEGDPLVSSEALGASLGESSTSPDTLVVPGVEAWNAVRLGTGSGLVEMDVLEEGLQSGQWRHGVHVGYHCLPFQCPFEW